ncbi:MAG: hypothetical protein K9L71_01900, partial [Candidatus Omnitrophica bacterium]|nr:hypothetical protein [Candidatus Omnitrophota bacterium]
FGLSLKGRSSLFENLIHYLDAINPLTIKPEDALPSAKIAYKSAPVHIISPKSLPAGRQAKSYV